MLFGVGCTRPSGGKFLVSVYELLLYNQRSRAGDDLQRVRPAAILRARIALGCTRDGRVGAPKSN